MAYYYFDSEDHSSMLHNSDVYLLANVSNYNDDNETTNTRFVGFHLDGDKTFTVGGNYKDADLYNIYQKNDVYTGLKIDGISEIPLLDNIRLAQSISATAPH